MDYEEMFTLISKHVIIRTLIAVVSVRQWPISQMDVKNAFLHGNLQEKFCKLRRLCMALNKLLDLGLKCFLLYLYLLDFIPVHMALFYLSDVLLLVSFYSLYILMTLLLIEMMWMESLS